MPKNVDHSAFDESHWVSAADAFEAAQEIHRRHALFVGPTSGAAWLAARWWARQHSSQLVVAIFPDEGHRYQTTVYNAEWLAAHGLTRAALPGAPVTVNEPNVPDETWSRFVWGRRKFHEVVPTFVRP
jgi:hypothetical protein